MEKIKVVTGTFVRKYSIPIGLSMDKDCARINTQPPLDLYILHESEIDQLIDKLLEIRKQYTDEKYGKS